MVKLYYLFFLLNLLIFSFSGFSQEECSINLNTITTSGITKQGLANGLYNENDLSYTFTGNGWNAFKTPIQIDSTDILTFDFKSTDEGEEHGIGFSNSLIDRDLNNQRYRLYGTQNTVNTSNQNFTYTGNGEWQTFIIPVGTYINGNFDYIVFINDNDSSPTTGNSSYRNVKILNSLGECKSVDYLFNFATEETNTPSPFIEDIGAAYGTNGSYGWLLESTNTAIDAFSEARSISTFDNDQIRESYISFNRESDNTSLIWEAQVPEGTYRVIITSGEPVAGSTNDTRHLIRVEGITAIDYSPNSNAGTRTTVVEVTVTDGRLTIDGSNGVNAKINAIAIQSSNELLHPAVIGSTPLDGATNVSPSTTISANFLSLPNVNEAGLSSLDNTTINNDTVKLFENDATESIDIAVNGTGGGDAINITVTGGLKENTQYTYIIEGVQDLAGATIFPYSAKFTTGTDINENAGNLNEISFTNQGEVASGMYSSLLIGPDNKLYGIRLSGEIDRWTISSDGSLTDIETINGLVDAYGEPRLAIGLAFDPNSTADNLIAYVSHSSFLFNDGPAYDGKISRLSGENLEQEELILTNLPRSVRDHLTNSIVFDPNDSNVLYFNQGSNSAGGDPDPSWGNRAERLLTAATLKLDLSLLPSTLPLDVQTSEDISVINNASNDSALMSDGTYNPYFSEAPLTIYASGIRNAYDLIWHSNGQLYVPTNGTAGGSQSPASLAGSRRPNGDVYDGPEIPFVSRNDVQKDFLFRIDPNLPVGYFGHPNPLRGEFVLNEGFTSTSRYPSYVSADSNYRGFAYDFGLNRSPNGVIEYQTEGVLKGALIVCRYSGGSDLIALVPDGIDGDISTNSIGIEGFDGFTTPLDLVEDTNTGNIYVSDLEAQQIHLLTLDIKVPENGITISFNELVNNQVIAEDEVLGVTINATDTDGDIENVQLFLNNVLVRTESHAPYEWGADNTSTVDLVLEELTTGTHIIKAIASDNEGNTEEISISITKEGPISPFTSPENNDIFIHGDPIDVFLDANLEDPNIDNIQLYAGNRLLGQENFAPYDWLSTSYPNLSNIRVGTHSLRAVFTYDDGTVDEKSINITIIPDPNAENTVEGTNIFVENLRKIPDTDISFPYDDRIVFQRSAVVTSEYHYSEFSSIRINNTGDTDLTVSSIDISNDDFELVDINDGLEFSLSPSESKDVLIHFVANEGDNGLREAELFVNSDDPTQPQISITLAGGFHENIFGANELSPLEVMQIFGFDTQIYGGTSNFITSSRYPTEESVASGEQGDLVLSRLWEQANPDEPINAFFLNVFKGEGATAAFFITEDESQINRIRVGGEWVQSLYPRTRGGDNLTGSIASASEDIDGQFAISLNTTSRSTLGFGEDATTGDPSFLPVRAYQVYEQNGTIRPNAYYIIYDFSAHVLCEDRSCDYNDLGLYVTNIKPSEEIIIEEPIVIDDDIILSVSGFNINNTSQTIDQSNDFILYPNPNNSDKIFANLNQYTIDSEIKVSIFNLVGVTLSTENIYLKEETISFNISNLSSGAYIFSIEDDKGKISTKLFEKY